MTHDSASMPNKKGKSMKTWQQITHYAGFDWARDHHAVVIVDVQGHIVADFEFEHTRSGWQKFREQTAAFPNLALAIETNKGAAVDQLLQQGCAVYPVNPASAKSYRQRKMPSGTKTDHIDGWTLADALRMDGQGWKLLAPTDDLSVQLKCFCQDEIVLIVQRTQLCNQLQQALVEYYPAALEAFDDWTMPSTWDFVIEFPTPEKLVAAGHRRWVKFLHTHRLWRPETTEKRLQIFAQADQFKGSAGITEAKCQLAVSLCKLLRTLQQQLDEYRQKIEALFARHPDHDLFGSLPGAKKVLAPRLLAAIGSDPGRYANNASVLQAFAGTAPISFQSGQHHTVKMRRACDKFLRHTVHLWADTFRHACPWGDVYYKKKRAEGMSHACALRCLAQRLLKIVFRMILDKKPYDAELHARNQQKHGSWVLSLVNRTPVQTGE
jgi:transposase